MGDNGNPEGITTKYILRCTKCGREYHRDCFTCVMQKVNAFRCNCGGKLEVEEIHEQEEISNIWNA